MSNYKNLLISEPPLQVLPTLAVAIGLSEAIVIQQLHYWVENTKTDGFIDKDGVKWIFNTYEQWHENFPFWSVHTIQRIFLNLEKTGIIVSAQLARDTHDKTKFYRIDYAKLEASNMPNWHYGTPHIGVMDDANLALCLNESETTAETTAESTNIKQKFIFVDHFGGFNGKRERERWGILEDAIGLARAEEIAAWAERKEIHMTNRGGLMDSLETAAKKWTDKPARPAKGDRTQFLKDLARA